MSKDVIAPLTSIGGGAGIGALVGSLVPGIGTGIGAAIGAGVGGATGSATAGLIDPTPSTSMPDMPAAPTPPAPTPATELPDPGDILKKKRKESSILKSLQGGSQDTIFSSGTKLGG